MKRLTKIVALLLALLMCIPVLIACKKNDEDKSKNTETISIDPSTMSDLDKRKLEKDNLPDWVSTKYQGRTITTYSFHENYELDINGYNEYTGSKVHDLVYKRNCIVESRLGITFDNIKSPAGHHSEFGKELGILANAQSGDYDVIYTMGNSAVSSGVEHIYFTDVTTLEYLSIDSPWWNRQAMENQSFDGKHLRYLVGDITLTTYNKAGAIFVNSVEYTNRYQEGLDGLYDIVIDGKWTIDVLLQKSKESYLDVYDDGLDDDGNDFIGFGIGNPVRVKALEYGFDVRRWSRDDEGFVKLDFDLERASIAVDKMIKLLFESPGTYYDASSYLSQKSFARGNMLFYENQLGSIMGTDFRDMDEDFGVLPTPKLDENQEEYTTEIQESSTFVVIPEMCPDKEFASVVVEALCAESYRQVILPYLEECLKIQYVRESRAGKIIDIILDSANKDYFGLNNPGGAGKLITNTVIMEVNRLSSNYRTVASMAEAALREIKTTYYS